MELLVMKRVSVLLCDFLFLAQLCWTQHCKHNALDRQTGACSDGCADGYYGRLCRQHCPARCKTCIDSGNCDLCKPGFYGHICEFWCDLCVDDECQVNGCTIGCKERYFRNEVHNFLSDGIKYTECQPCPLNCISCDSANHCTQCIDRYCGQTCSYKNCPGTVEPSIALTTLACGAESFLSSDGQCIPCPPNCLACISNIHCTKCKENYYGSICGEFNCSFISNCREYMCLQNKFDRNVDICSKCNEGYYGPFCNSSCSRNCGRDKESDCDMDTGECLHGCKRGFWGARCRNKCNAECANGDCHQLTGYCQYEPGYSVAGVDDQRGNTTHNGAAQEPGGWILTQIIPVSFFARMVVHVFRQW